MAGNDLERDLLDLPTEDEPRVDLPSALRGRILATVGAEHPYEGFVARLATFLDLESDRVRTLLRQVPEVDHSPWFDAGEGVRAMNFDAGPRLGEAHCGIVHIPPGATFPLHRHVGDEWAFTLRGTGREDSGRIWRPGDLLRSPADSRHSLTALGNEPFVFLAAAFHGIERE